MLQANIVVVCEGTSRRKLTASWASCQLKEQLDESCSSWVLQE
jgi:hypothetical protein